ncbi:hypothetical protein Pse7367_0137 [Thalassoporum mexicanum PCC 7367]|uniref:TIGR02391 family protein n=1 Tax=Thalassoporum mexicanum TaxID=3457544 RepID=UPI00029FED8E|nr:TIGR02391 family protein [Pseudanabaena sp. PCC 7367]AFY68454.1 hypothetical protein Pse7367_0137 [Pseudanabaena sp. PCC 7367]
MAYNLSPSQKSFLEWIVKEINEGNQERDFFVIFSSNSYGDSVLQTLDYPDEIKEIDFNFLCDQGFLYCSDSRNAQVTQQAFDVINSNFKNEANSEKICNLTEGQKVLARWIIEKIRGEGLDETFYAEFGANVLKNKLQSLFSSRGEIKLTRVYYKHDFDALENNGLMFKINTVIPSMNNELLQYAIKERLYSAVDSGFKDLSLSAKKYLKRDLEGIEHFDQEIQDRCIPPLLADGSNPKNWDNAIRAAGVILEERLRDIGGFTNTNETGKPLVMKIFRQKDGTLANKFADDKERESYMHLYAGVVGVFRNPSAHRFIDPTPEEGGAYIAFVDLLLKKLEALR